MSRTIKKKLTGGKAVSHQCRNNGTCTYCIENRTYKNNKKLDATIYSLNTINK